MMTDRKFNAGVAVMRNSKLVSGLISGICLGALVLPGTAMAQFGGYPTKTPQEAKDQGSSSTSTTKDEDKASYLVVDQRFKGKNGYTSIQAAIDDVAAGGVVLVMPGVYHENVVLDKPVSLQGDRGPGLRVRIAPKDGTSPCLTYQPENDSDHALISNIEFTTVEMVVASSRTESEAARAGKVANREYFTNEPCISVKGGVFTMKESTVSGLVDRYNADFRGSSLTEYANNEIADSYLNQGYMNRSMQQPDTQVFYNGVMVDIQGGTAFLEKNTIRGGMEGIRVAQQHPLWDRTTLVDNKITENNSLGIHLTSASGVQATGNLIELNGIGIKYNGEGDATIVGNKILNNFNDGILLDKGAKEVMLSLNKIARNYGNGVKIIRANGYIRDDNIFEDNGWGGAYFYDVNTMDAGYNNVPKIGNGIAVNAKNALQESRNRDENQRNKRFGRQ